MPTIKKRGIAAPQDTRPDVVQQCHYTILRHPLRDVGKGNFHAGPEPTGILAVHNGAISSVRTGGTTTDANELFCKIADENPWFINRHPGRYSVVSSLFGMSFTFLVMQDGTYHKGWLLWPQFLQGERDRGVNTL